MLLQMNAVAWSRGALVERGEALLRFYGCAEEGRRRYRGPLVVLQKVGVAEFPELCCSRKEALLRSRGCNEDGKCAEVLCLYCKRKILQIFKSC